MREWRRGREGEMKQIERDKGRKRSKKNKKEERVREGKKKEGHIVRYSR